MAVKSGYIGNKIFEAKDVCKTYISPSTGEEKVILRHFNYVFSRYEKLGIIGNNGTGKSTFIKLLLGEVPADSGTWGRTNYLNLIFRKKHLQEIAKVAEEFIFLLQLLSPETIYIIQQTSKDSSFVNLGILFESSSIFILQERLIHLPNHTSGFSFVVSLRNWK